MWLCTKLGFFSIVAKTRDEVHIRARAQKDLENLRTACSSAGVAAFKWKILNTHDADYRFRVIVSPDAVPKIMARLGELLDYSNFKGVIASTPDQRDKLAIYSAFHHDMEHWQNR